MPTSDQFLSVCQKCKALCCTLVLPPVTEEERNAILDAEFRDCFTNICDGIYAIIPGDHGKCPYLKQDYSCEIQPLKPKLCRIWPVIPRYKNNERGCIVIKCLLFSHLSSEALKQSKKDAETIPLEIIENLWDISHETKEKYKIFEYEEI